MEHDTNKIDYDFLKIQYQVLSNKQLSHHTSMWNAPSLLFVAQTFLWSISLDHSLNILIRCIVSLVSIVIAFAALQNFIRNRWMEIADCEQLVAIENLMRSRTDAICPAMIVHHKFVDRTVISKNGRTESNMNMVLLCNKDFQKSIIGQLRTYCVWKIVFGVVVALAIIVFLYDSYLAIRIFIEVGSITKMMDCNVSLS